MRPWLRSLALVALLAGCGADPASLPADVLRPDAVDAMAEPDAPADTTVDTATSRPYSENRAPCADYDPLRRVFFGDLHAHTARSWDAYAYDVRVTPAEAYAFARGEPVRLPPLDAAGRGTREVRLARPLDFAALTDHLEFVGETHLCTTPTSPVYDSAACAAYRVGGESGTSAFGIRLAFTPDLRDPAICGLDGALCRDAARTVWGELRRAAEAAYDRGPACAFVSFVGYEYTASPRITNLHRNVVFRNDDVPEEPPSAFEEPAYGDLWNALDTACLVEGERCDVVVLPHNSNWSNGTLYPPADTAASRDEQRATAALRARLEPVAEVFQHKGQMECRNGFAAVIGEPDPECEFELIRPGPLDDCGEGTGAGGVQNGGCESYRDYLRTTIAAGLAAERQLGVNPYKFGFIGSTDTHDGTPGNTEERGFPGHVGLTDDTAAKRVGEGTLTHDAPRYNPGGLAAIWAEERSRDALFDALRRREVYATSGTRIAVRLFAGWNYDAELCATPEDLARVGYAGGVPMGGDLPPAPAGTGAPRLAVAAWQDAGTPVQPGALLERLQVVKSAVDADGRPRTAVYDVAVAPAVGTVDPATCAPVGGGAATLCGVWEDPDFDPSTPAAYYARVLEVPTCRWSAFDCATFPDDARPTLCDDPAAPHVIRERAVTSPVWYTPPVKAE